MAELRGGTTIGGYTALHSGLKEAYLGGNLTLTGNIKMGLGATSGITGAGALPILLDYGNGNVTLSATGGQLYLGYTNTTNVRLEKNLVNSTGTVIADTAAKLYYQGQDVDTRYVKGTGNYAAFDLSGSTAYPRLVANNTGATTPQWIRVGDSSGSYGLLPYTDASSNLGTSSWRFSSVHAITSYATNFMEDGILLGNKYVRSDWATVGIAGNLTWNNGVDSLDALKSSVSSGKELIATAITDKGQGQFLGQARDFASLSNAIGAIEQATGNAVAANLLVGKTASTTAGNITGTMPDNTGTQITPGFVSKSIPVGYHYNSVVKGEYNLSSENIVKGVSIFGVLGSAIVGKRWASGTAASHNGVVSQYAYVDGYNTTGAFTLNISGLSFRPSMVYIYCLYSGYMSLSLYSEGPNELYPKVVKVTGGNFGTSTGAGNTYQFKGDVLPARVYDGGFSMPVVVTGSFNWIAYE